MQKLIFALLLFVTSNSIFAQSYNPVTGNTDFKALVRFSKYTNGNGDSVLSIDPTTKNLILVPKGTAGANKVDSAKVLPGQFCYYIDGVAFCQPVDLQVDSTTRKTNNGQIVWLDHLNFMNQYITYNILGEAHYVNQGIFSLNPAHPSLDRWDNIIGDNLNRLVVLEGIPGGVKVQVDPITQIEFLPVQIKAGDTVPNNIRDIDIYRDKNILYEWTGTSIALPGINFDYTVNPRQGAKSVYIPSGHGTGSVIWTALTNQSISGNTFLKFYVRLSAPLPVNGRISIAYLQGNTWVSNAVNVGNGNFGFDGSLVGVYQPIFIPFTSWNFQGNQTLNKVVFGIYNMDVTFQLDDVSIQDGGSNSGATGVQSINGMTGNVIAKWYDSSAYNIDSTLLCFYQKGVLLECKSSLRKTLLAGANTTLTPSVTGDSITISSSGSGGSGDYIYRDGTHGDSAVTGDIGFLSPTFHNKLYSTDDIFNMYIDFDRDFGFLKLRNELATDPTKYAELNMDAGNASSMSVGDVDGYTSTFSFGNPFIVDIGNPSSVGIKGRLSYIPNYNDSSFVQKKYVDDAIAASTGGVTSKASTQGYGILIDSLTTPGVYNLRTDTSVLTSQLRTTAGLALKLNLSDTAAMESPNFNDVSAPNDSTLRIYRRGGGFKDVVITGSGNSGTVTNFASGNASPLFTTSVTNPTGSVSQTFALTNPGTKRLFGTDVGTPTYLTSIDSTWVPDLHSQNYYDNRYTQAAGSSKWTQTGNTLYPNLSYVKIGVNNTSPTSSFQVNINGIAASVNDSISIINKNGTAAVNGTQQPSGGYRWDGNAFGTTAGTSQLITHRMRQVLTQGTTPTGNLILERQINGGGYLTLATFSNVGALTVPSDMTAANFTTAGQLQANTIQLNVASAAVSAFALGVNQGSVANSTTTARWSPYLRWLSSAWNTTTLAANSVEFGAEVRSLAGNPVTGNWVLWSNTNAGGITPLMQVSNIGRYNLTPDYFTPATGATVVSNKTMNIINPAGTLATLTVTLPASPANGDIVEYSFSQAVTVLTFNGGTLANSVTTTSAGGHVKFQYSSTSTLWHTF